MKRCPECIRDYYDDTLLYCLDDGNALLEGPGYPEPATLIIGDGQGSPKPGKGVEDREIDSWTAIANLPVEAPTEILPASRGRHSKNRNALWIGFGAVVVLGLIIAAWEFGSSTAPKESSINLGNVTLTPLTNDPGYEGEPTFSPDGETIAYVSDRSGNFEIYIQQVSGGAYRNISENPADDVQPAFSPDGRQIAFVSSRSSSTALRYEGYDLPLMGGDIWVMPALGGNARRAAQDGNFPSWSRDGSAILYTAGPAFGQKIYRVSPLGGERQEIVPKLNTDSGVPRFLLYPSYSSDERWIVFEADSPTGFGPRDIWVMNVQTAEVQHIAKGLYPKWNSNSTAIIFSSTEPGKNFSLWQVPFSQSDGKVAGSQSPLTVSRGRDVQPAVAKDGRAIAFAGVDFSFNVETRDFDPDGGKVSEPARPVTSGRQVGYFQSFSPDARTIVFESRFGARSHLWKVVRDSAPVQLTDDPGFDDTYPRWSPTGGSIAFIRKSAVETAPFSAVWLMTEEGANPRLAVDKAQEFAWMPDGRGIAYFSMADRQIHVFDIASGSDRAITKEPAIVRIFTVSPDGRWLAFQSLQAGNSDIKIIPIAGGESRLVVATSHQDYHPFIPKSGKWLYYLRDHKNLFRVPGPAQDWRPAEPQQVTNFPESGLFLDDPQVSNDGRQLLYSHGHLTGDIWLLRYAD